MGRVAILAVLFLAVVGAMPIAVAAEPIGHVEKLTGAATIKRDDVGRPATVGAVLRVGDTLITHFGTRLRARMDDDTVLTMGAFSVLVLESYVYEPSPPRTSAALTLTRGALRTVTGRVGAVMSDTFTVKTPVGTIGIRGTDFFSGEHEGRFDVILLQGGGLVLANDVSRVEITRVGEGISIPVEPPADEAVPTDRLSLTPPGLGARMDVPLPDARIVPQDRLSAVLGQVAF